jgi:hypothetical protein
MDRSLRPSTAKARESSSRIHQEHLRVKLWNATINGRLDETLELLEQNKYDAKNLGSILLEFLFRRNFTEIRRYGHAAVMRLVESFVFHGADMYAVDRFGTDMVSAAIKTRDTILTRFVIENTECRIAHHDTTSPWPHQPRMFDATTVDMAKLMLEYGADTSKEGRYNTPLLQFQVSQMYHYRPTNYPPGAQFQLIRFLLEELKCDVHGCDDSGTTALHSSVEFYGKPVIIQLLLDHGADVHAVDHRGRTPLFPAVESHKLRHVQL